MDPVEIRQTTVSTTKRMVVKVGSRLLTDMPGVEKQQRIEELVDQIDSIRRRGIEVILVTSGAIGAGLRLMKQTKRPSDLGRLQALAAVGQSRLMSLYEQACQRHGFHCGQVLLSADDVRDRKRHLNICNCLNALLSNHVLPIINENDTVSVEEICFGDNDRLAALVGSMIRADLIVLLTTVNGLRERRDGQMGERISVVHEINDEIRRQAGPTDGNAFSKGGMTSKLEAAEITVTSGEALWIADGSDFGVLDDILHGSDTGTLFLPTTNRLAGSKRYLAFFSEPAGQVIIDDGAVEALRSRGKSLLPSGIHSVRGQFDKGDTVNIVALDQHVVGMGVSNFSAADLDRIKGLKTSESAVVLGRDSYDEAIHRDNLVILD